LFAQRGGAFGQGLLWEWDLLNLKEGNALTSARWR
jgi:hypothetical protein